MDCPQCGESTESFHEGYCLDCCEENQNSLDDHNYRFDEWKGLSNAEREARINHE